MSPTGSSSKLTPTAGTTKSGKTTTATAGPGPGAASSSKSGKTATATTGAATTSSKSGKSAAATGTAAASTGKKSIFIFCDGTGNDGNTAAPSAQTNVKRLLECLDDKAPDGTPQLAFYQQGLGTTPEVLKGEVKGVVPDLLTNIKAQAMGTGIVENIAAIWMVLCATYEDGDKIFIFGFSRGAYTARILASLVTTFGLLDPKNFSTPSKANAASGNKLKKPADAQAAGLSKERLAKAVSMVNLWKDEKGKDIKDWKKQPADTTTEEFAKELIEVEVTVLGVYDSVSALLPDKDAFVFAEPLNEKILHAYHAIALTERRTKFFPVMWDFAPAGMLTSDPPKLIQCWFMGTHSAVGGSHGQEGVKIDDLTLLWMLGRIDGLAGIDEAQVKKFFLNEKTGQTVKGIEDSKVEGLKLLNAAVHMNFGGIVTSIGKEHLRDQELGFGVGETIHISVHLFRKYTEIKDQGTVFTKLFAQTPPQPTQGGAVAKTKKIGNKNIEADDDDPDEAKSDAGSEDSLPSGPEDEDEEPEGTGRFTWELNATRGQPTQLGTEGKTLTKAKSIPEDDPSPYEAARLETTSTEKPVFDLRRGEDGQRKANPDFKDGKQGATGENKKNIQNAGGSGLTSQTRKQKEDAEKAKKKAEEAKAPQDIADGAARGKSKGKAKGPLAPATASPNSGAEGADSGAEDSGTKQPDAGAEASGAEDSGAEESEPEPVDPGVEASRAADSGAEESDPEDSGTEDAAAA